MSPAQQQVFTLGDSLTISKAEQLEEVPRLPTARRHIPPASGSDRAALVTRVSRVAKPWGHEEIFALVPNRFCGKSLHVRAGHALSLQYHNAKEEVIAVQSGVITVEVGPSADSLTEFEMRAGDSIHLRPGVLHRVTARTDAILLEASTTELHDVVRLEDRYGRKGTSAP